MRDTTKIYKSTLIYTIGNFGARILNFIMFPIYSYFLTTSEYGSYDLIISVFALVLPVITLQVPESIMKFASEDSKETVISTSLCMCFTCVIVGGIIGVTFLTDSRYKVIILWLALQLISKYLLQITRCLGKNYIYSVSSIFSTFFSIVSTSVFLIGFKMGITALILSGIVTEIFTIIFLVLKSGALKYFSIVNISLLLLKKMIRFSIPLIPTAMIWWIMNSSDKYIINYFMGNSYNGIYAISYKFPTMITILYGFYNLAWQDFIFLNENEFDFKPIINQFLNFIISISVPVMFVAKVVCQVMVSKEYYESYLYIPPLILAMVFYCVSGFLGIAYRKSGNTGKEFKTSILGAVVNFIINIIFIKYIGLWSASISTMVSFIIVAMMRYHDTKGFFKYNFMNVKNLMKIAVILCFIVLYYIESNIITIICIASGVVLVVLMNKQMLMDLLQMFTLNKTKDN